MAAASATPPPAPEKPKGISRRAFYRAFLGAADVGDRFQSLAEPDVDRGLARRYRRGQKPQGLWWVADSEWSDPHSDEALRRVMETRWYFADEAAASRFVGGIVEDLREHWRSEDTEGPSFGSDCHVLKGAIEETVGTMVHYVYVFRVERIVAELWFDQGPRAKKLLAEEAVVPFAKRAAERVAGAVGAGDAADGVLR
jgi:hypothetical protein